MKGERLVKVVVTGVAGFIGSTLADRLLSDGHEVVGIDCFTDYYDRAEKEANLTLARRSERFRLIEADLRDAVLEPFLDGADAVINEAATPGLALSWDRFDAYATCNLGGLQRLVAAALAVGVPHFVQASTSSVYGAVATGPESGPTVPVSPYGVTKLAAEQLLEAYRLTAGLPFTVLRYFSVYGPRQRPDMAYRIFCERMLAGEEITVYGDGQQSRSNTYVDDCVSATVAALGRAPDGATFNIGGGVEITLTDALRRLAEVFDVEPRVVYAPARRGDQRRTMANTSAARRLLDWEPVTGTTEGLARQARWVQARA